MNNIFKFSFGIFTTLAVAWLAFVVGARKQFGDLSPTSSVLSEDGNVPEDINKLEELPSVGHKTASVVMSQAFGQPAFPVDTHIHRLAYRWKLSTGKNVDKTEKDLKAIFPIDTWNKAHLQIIYFGRKYCPARGHDPLACPICKDFGRASLFT